MLERLEAASGFVLGIADGGGSVAINAGLFGDENIGDVIDWPVLVRLAALKVQLGVEVFPTMQMGW